MIDIEDSARSPSRRARSQRRPRRRVLPSPFICRCAPQRAGAGAGTTDGQFAPNAFIRIDHAGKITLVMPQVEMGQGVYTAVAMILAEELDADFGKVELEHAPPNEKLYANPMLGIQATGNSNSIRAFWKPLRQAGAAARAMLVQAAAQRWQVDPASCTAANGDVTMPRAGARLPMAIWSTRLRDLRRAAESAAEGSEGLHADRQAAQAPRYAEQDQRRGDLRHRRHASRDEVRDARRLSGFRRQGRARSTTARPEAVPGVRQIVVLDDLVAVVGDHIWAAKKGLDALKITWDEGPNAKISSADIWEDLRAASKKDGVVAKSVGDIAKGLAQGERFDAEYEMPLLAHATMEPMNCTVRVTPDACEVWIGTQVIARVQEYAAKAAGLPMEKVTVHQHFLGGGFGRRLEPDMAESAVRIGKHVDGAVKVIWMREEDIQHDVYRPVYRDVISATLLDGKIAAWKYRISGSSVMARWLPPGYRERRRYRRRR